MITIAHLWEDAWLEPDRTERLIWRQMINAYNVDRWCAAIGTPGKFTQPDQFVHIDDMFADLTAPRTFLVCPGTMPGIDLCDYTHPADAIYIFGNSDNCLTQYVRPEDDVVSIYTPTEAALFSFSVIGTVLYDRACKQVH